MTLSHALERCTGIRRHDRSGMNFTDGNVIGADVSLYQDDNGTLQRIDFTKMVGQGASFVIVRAGQNAWVDPDFAYNWANAKAAGLPRGSYWFYDSRYPPLAQAELFAGLFATDKPELELWLDLEEAYGGSYAGWKNWKIFLTRLHELLPSVKIGIYTGYYYFTGKIPASEYPFFSAFGLWIAWYTSNPANVSIPVPWTNCLYWQWGTPSWGLAWGCESIEIDMNKFNGTAAEFSARYGIGGGTDPMPTDKYYLVTVDALNVRDALTGGNPIFTIQLNDVVHSVENGTDGNIVRHKIDKLYKAGVLTPFDVTSPTGQYWAAEKNTSTGNVFMVETSDPNPPQKVLTHTIKVFDDGSIVIDG